MPPTQLSRNVFPHPGLGTVAAIAITALCALSAEVASAQAHDQAPDEHRGGESAAQSAREGMFLLHTIAPASNRTSPGVVLAAGGYDSANDVPVMDAVGDLTVIGPLDVRLGVAYGPDTDEGQDEEGTAQPHFAARVRVLSQREQGIDGAFVLGYRMDRFTDEEGLVHGGFTAGRRFGRLGTFASVGYGQDIEGDDREAELAMALLLQASSNLQLGLESRVRWDLFSNDPKRSDRGSGLRDLVAGPSAHYAIGPIALLAQAGIHTTRVDDLKTGAIVLAGLGYAY